jgi:hypothetical protein
MFMLMNTAPAELLQLLTNAALQPRRNARRRVIDCALFSPPRAPKREKKKPPCLKIWSGSAACFFLEA